MATVEKSLHVLIACGGTGGHLFPGIAVGEVLKARGHEATLLISEKKIDSLAASGHVGLSFEKMPFLAMPRIYSPKMLPFGIKFLSGLRACKKLIAQNKTQVVLGMGGFTSTAPVIAGKWAKCKTLIHDSNALPGKANRLTARFCDMVLLGFAEAGKFFPKNDTRVTGTPVRTNLRAEAKAGGDDPFAFFKLEPGRKTLLVMGGSQGARGVNEAVTSSLDVLAAQGWQVLHITGPADYQAMHDAYQKTDMVAHAHVAAFCHRMELAYQIADVAIARSGASTLAELAYFGVPSILVPYPFAADDHQTKNAEIFAQTGAGLLIKQSDLNAAVMASVLSDIVALESKYATMKAAARKLSHDDAAERIADIIEELAAQT